MKRIIGFSALVAVAALGLFAISCGKNSDNAAATTEAKRYHCPMHPEVVSDKPGSCPKCNMALEPTKAHQPAKAGIDHWTCSMHPFIRSDKPGLCPQCKMELTPVYKPGVEGAPTSPGAVYVSPQRQQLIGIRTEVVAKRALTKIIRTTATIKPDETRWTQINPRIGGWVEELYVDYTGKLVEKGQPLFKLYSPELVLTQKEYLNALNSGSASLIRAARRRLDLWLISDDQVAELEKTGEASDMMIVRSPATGFVIKKDLFKGKAFMAGETLYEIADLSRVWLRGVIYEYELPLLQLGQKARVTLPAFPGEEFEATVTYIYPTLNEMTRTIEVRLDLPNPNFRFKPDMWANVEIEVDLGERLVVPRDAVVETGQRRVAFVDLGNGYFEPRQLRLGQRVNNWLEILDGLHENEKIVTAATFLIDAESRWKTAMEGMRPATGDSGERKAEREDAATHRH
jgi:Cu(I)/Ag(I) efflux system membrane fusion protein